MTAPRRWSVVMPTCSRAEVLRRTVAAFLAQLDPAQDELIVVDDGSTDETPTVLAELTQRHGDRLIARRQPNAGPATARNHALAIARGRWVLFAGDDVIPAPGMLEAHGRALARDARVASLGLIRWHPELPINAFMRWLERSGAQFAYDGLRDGQELPPEMAYSSNLAVARDRLPPAPVFDPAFRAACWEDVDLGLRLAARGVGIRYAEAALGWHLHPTDLADARRRAERVGYYRALLHHKHGLPPERHAAWRLAVKSVCAPLLRWLPLRMLQAPGFRWTLAGPDAAGYARFRREAEGLHSRA